ncbi:MAG: hypothetical protein FJ257_06865 [Phycisphaerae bacterium]|nr:hypothetical protein [Phycisphaerae bacterium]
MTLDDVRHRIAPIRSRLEELGVTRIRVFGSVARDEATSASDVDCLLDFDGAPSLFTLARARSLLSEAIGVEVDVATPGMLRGPLVKAVARDLRDVA